MLTLAGEIRLAPAVGPTGPDPAVWSQTHLASTVGPTGPGPAVWSHTHLASTVGPKSPGPDTLRLPHTVWRGGGGCSICLYLGVSHDFRGKKKSIYLYFHHGYEVTLYHI